MNYKQIIESLERKKSSPYPVKGNKFLNIKDISVEERIVTGVYSTMNYFDSDDDVILPGAYLESIKEMGPLQPNSPYIKHLLFHDMRRMPGKIQVLEEKEIDGKTVLYFETKMAETPDGLETVQKYHEEVYDNHSVGFRYVDLEYTEEGEALFEAIAKNVINESDLRKKGYMYAVKKLRLFEGSTVGFGANKLTPFLGLKSEDKKGYLEVLNRKASGIERILDKGKVSEQGGFEMTMELAQMKQIIREMSEIDKTPVPKQSLKNKKTSFNLLREYVKL